MPKGFAITTMVGGAPNIDFTVTPVHGFALCDQVAGFGAYLFSGTNVQLLALNALPNVMGLCIVTEDANVKWAELDGVIAPAVRTKLNVWLTARGFVNVPAGMTYRAVITAVYQRLNSHFDLSGFDIAES